MKPPRLVNVKRAQLHAHYVGVDTFGDWLARPNSVYIGRFVRHVPKTFDSDFGNHRRLGHADYIWHVLTERPHLLEKLHGLDGKDIGCWCVKRPEVRGERTLFSPSPVVCHGQAVQQLFEEHVVNGLDLAQLKENFSFRQKQTIKKKKPGPLPRLTDD